MKTENKDKEIDINEVAFTLDVDIDLVEKVRNGEITHITLEINENNQNLILENIDGHLVLAIDELPTKYHSCYMYNNGKFPYVIKETLNFLVLNGGKDGCLARIVDINIEPGVRFLFQDTGEPSVEDPNGDNCIWEVTFEVVPVLESSKTYLMRWNPSISSFSEKDYEECMANLKHGVFRVNWSIRDWEEARRGDCFYMLRVGDDKAGVVFNGMFTSDPYPADDWAGSTKRRMYVDMACTFPEDPGVKPRLSIEKLQKDIPDYEWSKGYSGALLSEEVTTKLDKLFSED